MIQIEGLQKVIAGTTVLDIPQLAVKAGEIAAIVGDVESGLETLFDLLIGRVRPSSGASLVAGIDPFADRHVFSRRVGVLFVDDNLYPRMSVRDNLRFFTRLRRLPAARADDMLSTVGLADQTNVLAEALPSSLARRLGFGRALLHQPKLLLLAEPFAKCDEASVTLLSGLMHQSADEGTAILILAEDTDHLDSLCDTIHRLEKGRISESYRPEDATRSGLPFMIPARGEGKVDLVDPADILYIAAQDDRTTLHTRSGPLPTQFTLAELETRLARRGFFRAHRSYLVNLQHVKEVIPFTRNSYSLRIKDNEGTLIPLSRAAASELRDLLGY
jgi:ABC-2 type transport system ATP-binding protein